jgi:methionine-rich copper-binding protein CopC
MQMIQKLSISVLLLFLTLFLTSASIAPKTMVEKAPPVEKTKLTKKAAKKQLKQQKRVSYLKNKLAKAKTEKQKTRLRQRIAQNETGQAMDIEILSIIALVFAFLFAPLGLVLALIALKRGGGLIAEIAFWVSLIVIAIYLLIIILSILR